VIYFNNVSKVYKDATALLDVTFTVEAGEFVSVVGHSGAGKTTLTKMILAEENPTDGTVFFESIDVHKLKSKDLTKLRRRIGVVFQDYKLLSNKTAYENIAFAMEAVGKTDEEIESDVPHVLELVDLSHRANHFPTEMSGGEQQRVAIARALVGKPKLLLADEPTGNLDPHTGQTIAELLQKLHARHDLTSIIVTHNEKVARICSRTYHLENGSLNDCRD